MKKIISVFIVPIVLLICSCTGQSLRINRNDIILQKSDTILQKIAFDSFELKEKKGDDIIIVGYEFKDEPEAVGLPKYHRYEGELLFAINDKSLKPILNIVHELQYSSGPRIKLLRYSDKKKYIDVEYDVQLYKQRPAAFGTVKICYERTGNETDGYQYTVVDYKSDLTSHFKRADEEDPTIMIPSMEGDIIKHVDLSLEEFEKIANQVLDFMKSDI